MPDSVPNVSEGEASPNRGVMIVLAYLWLLALVPLLLEKHDREVQWHAKHGIVLMAAELVALLVYVMVTSIISLATFSIGCVLSLFLVFAWVGVLALHVIAIIKGINGDRLIIPGISEYANRL
jgi:uncharacterized membrane protein